jgi:hypothetical protein
MAFTFDARWLIDSSFSFWDWPYILFFLEFFNFIAATNSATVPVPPSMKSWNPV